MLRQLLPERLRFTPREAGGYEITTEVALGGLLSVVVDDGSLAMVPSGGFTDPWDAQVRGIVYRRAA